MSVTLLGTVATAGVLGVTHAVEPDHVAGITSLTGRYGDARLSAFVGACFSAGHVALVVCWLGIGYLLPGRTGVPPVFDTVGTVGVAAILGVLGAALATGGLRQVVYAHDHEGARRRHTHVRLPFLGDDGDDAHATDHTTTGFLKTGVVGALFTLSPPLSMIVFASTLLAAGPELVAVAVGTYAVAITGTMSALGAGAGAVFARTAELDVQVHGATQALAGALVVGLAVTVATGVFPVFG
ncbi:hypothetical protein [Halobellus ruber]|uniref:Nickel/cobalt efflux system n=1 Tax=Halobellus ruber TaxID=2761102 RepID=A0A7J9SIT5_9EURY|nr:hypothetical protein [Halobellus ruber]MBB6646029.1 hypothetical protein [Halobellus ruber]